MRKNHKHEYRGVEQLTVRLTGASSGANPKRQELLNTELAPAEYQMIPALLS